MDGYGSERIFARVLGYDQRRGRHHLPMDDLVHAFADWYDEDDDWEDEVRS